MTGRYYFASGREGGLERHRVIDIDPIGVDADFDIDMDRIGVENRCCSAKGKVETSQQRILHPPSILYRRHSLLEQSRSTFRSFLSTSIDQVIDIDRFGVENSNLHSKGESRGESAKNFTVPENRDASILYGRHRVKSK